MYLKNIYFGGPIYHLCPTCDYAEHYKLVNLFLCNGCEVQSWHFCGISLLSLVTVEPAASTQYLDVVQVCEVHDL